jgi:predicted nucleotidyltransferase
MITTTNISIDQNRISAFSEKWKITEFSLFGSVLTDDFRSDSDVDVLVTFSDDADWSLFELVDMEDELREIFGREVDLVLRKTVERSDNYIRRKAILSSSRRIYGA